MTGLVLLAVGTFAFVRAPTFQKRVGLSPEATEAPGPVQTGVNRIIGVLFGVVGLGLLVFGVVIFGYPLKSVI